MLSLNSSLLTDLPAEAVVAVTTATYASTRLMGAHMPTSGGLHKALLIGKEIGCDAVQLFTASPRQWNAPTISEAQVSAFQAAREQTGIAFAIAHDSYLINLAAPDTEILQKSQEAFRRELERAEQLGLRWVVTHMGAHLNQGETEAVERLIASLRSILEETDRSGYAVGIALETTAGQGSGLGWRFEQLGQVLTGVGDHARLGVCLDTCHIFAAGYDLRDETSYAQTWADFDRHIGLDKLKVIHANDCKKPLGSRVDRHDHIGEGELGLATFARLVNDPRLQHVPMIVETPESETMHTVNLARLRGLERQVSGAMTVHVHFFGHYADFYAEPLPFELPIGATLGALAGLLAERDARLVDIARHCRFAVQEEYAALETILEEGHVVAVLPPMSGG